MYENYCGGSCRSKRGGDKPLLIGSENMSWAGRPMCSQLHSKIVFLGGWSDRKYLYFLLCLATAEHQLHLKGHNNSFEQSLSKKKKVLHLFKESLICYTKPVKMLYYHYITNFWALNTYSAGALPILKLYTQWCHRKKYISELHLINTERKQYAKGILTCAKYRAC